MRRRKKTTRVEEDEWGEAVRPGVDWGLDCEEGGGEGGGCGGAVGSDG